MADWSPVVWNIQEPNQFIDGRIIPGGEIITRAWRCAIHDAPTGDWLPERSGRA